MVGLHAGGVLERMEANITSVLHNDIECISTVHCLKVGLADMLSCRIDLASVQAILRPQIGTKRPVRLQKPCRQ